ncbi:MAG: CD225/dispanin family protein [Prevotella sp.]|nr:CD225/dispanin family protein [Prevotella sp.]
MTTKIAIISSGEGRHGIHVTEFFKEGNRISTACLLTDSEGTPAAMALQTLGVGVAVFEPKVWANNPEEIVHYLQLQGVRIVLVDDFDLPIPTLLVETFPGAILVEDDLSVTAPDGVYESHKSISALYPDGEKTLIESTPARAENLWPRAVVAAICALDKEQDNIESPAIPNPEDVPEIPTSLPSPESEWAEALHISTAPPQTCAPAIPQTPPAAPHPAGQPPIPDPKKMPPNYLVWAIVSLILCCLIPSVVAIYYSSRVNSQYYSGDIEGAWKSSRRAEIWIIVSIVAGLVANTFSMPLSLLFPG